MKIVGRFLDKRVFDHRKIWIKAGTSTILREFYKWLNEKARQEIIHILNKFWNNEWFLETMEEAKVESPLNDETNNQIEKLDKDE